MDRAHEHGINFFDTANVYGWKKGEGVTEQIIGRWFAQGGGRRERTVLATKLYGDMGDWPNDSKLSALNIRRACDASLQPACRPTTSTSTRCTTSTGRRRGTRSGRRWRSCASRARSSTSARPTSPAGTSPRRRRPRERRHFLGLVAEQSIYNLIERTVELEVLPAALDYGLGVIPWSPLHGGLLGGILRKGEDAVARQGRACQGDPRDAPDAIEAYEAFCDGARASTRRTSAWPGCCTSLP